MKKTLTMITATTMLTVASAAVAADKPATIKAVGTWGSLTNYQKHEGPFLE